MNDHRHDKLDAAIAAWRAAGSPGAGATHDQLAVRRTAGLHIRAHAAAHGVTQASVAKLLQKRLVDVTFDDLLAASVDDRIARPHGGTR